MSTAVLERLKAELGDKILATSSFRGDDEAIVASKDWTHVAAFLRNDAELAMDHFVDLTAIDYPERVPSLPRFDVVLLVRSMAKNHRVRLKTRVADGEELDTLVGVWKGANWTEREVFDMFGIRFKGHPDMRRILLYEEFVGHPLRKDYPIEKTQPLMAYRDADNIQKLPPFGATEGQPWARIDWQARLEGADLQVSPSIGLQQGQKHALSESSKNAEGKPLPDEIPGKA